MCKPLYIYKICTTICRERERTKRKKEKQQTARERQRARAQAAAGADVFGFYATWTEKLCSIRPGFGFGFVCVSHKFELLVSQ